MPLESFGSFPRLNFWAGGLALALASALLRYWALAQTSYANGWDSYYYLVQLKSLEETGRMHAPEASLIYPYLRLFYWITGDYVTGMKVGTAVLAGAFTATLYWLARIRSHSVASGPLVLAAWSVYSPQLTYFAAQYPKNLLGVVLLVAFIGSLEHLKQAVSQPIFFDRIYRIFSPKKSCKRLDDLSWPAGKAQSWAFMIFLLTINYFAHRFTFVLAMIYLAFWLIFQFKNATLKELFSRGNLLIVGLALVFFVAASRIFPGLFHFSDFERLTGVRAWPPQFAPYSFVRQFGPERISVWWLAEVALVTGCWLFVLGYRLLGRAETRSSQSPIQISPSPIPLLALCTLLLFPFLEWSFTGIAWRFFLIFVLLTPLLVIDFQLDKWRRSGVIFVALLLSCSVFSWKSYDPAMHDPDYARFAEITKRSNQILRGKNAELVIAHNALAEFFTFTTGTDAMPWLPEYAVDSNRLWRIAGGVGLQTLQYYAGEADDTSIVPLGYRYYLLPEYLWQRARTRATTENDERFLAETCDWRNPCQSRPEWLLQRKRAH